MPKLSCGRKIWLLVDPLPPSPVNKLSLFLSLPVCRCTSLLTGERGEGVGKEPNHTTAREPGPLQLIQPSVQDDPEKMLPLKTEGIGQAGES
jgi:hypothetical protein